MHMVLGCRHCLMNHTRPTSDPMKLVNFVILLNVGSIIYNVLTKVMYILNSISMHKNILLV